VPADRSANSNEIKLRMELAFMSSANNKVSNSSRSFQFLLRFAYHVHSGIRTFLFGHSHNQGRPQAWAGGGGTCSFLEMLYSVLCIVTVKRSVDQLFKHYFDNLSFVPRPSWGFIPGRH